MTVKVMDKILLSIMPSYVALHYNSYGVAVLKRLILKSEILLLHFKIRINVAIQKPGTS